MRRTDPSFPKDGAEWTAVSFGKVYPNPEVTSELLVELHLARERLGADSRFSTVFHTSRVGIGALPATPLGSVWVDGEQVGQDDRLVERVGSVEFPSGGYAPVGAWHRLRDGEFLIPPRSLRIPGPAKNSLHLMLPASQHFGGQLVLPCAEVARAWYLRSTPLALALSSDLVERAIANILDLNVPVVPGENAICLREGFSDSDLTVAAALRYSKFFAFQASQLVRGLIAANLQRKDAYINLVPPVTGKHRVKALGIPINDGGKSRFLALRLLSIPAPAFDVPPDSIVYYARARNEGIAGADATSEGSRSTYKYISPRIRAPHPGLTHTREPNKAIASRHIAPDVPSFSDEPIFEVREPPPRLRGLGSGASISGDPQEEYSTGAGSWAGSVAPVRFVQDGDPVPAARTIPPALAAAFDEVEPVIPLLENEGCTIHTLSNQDRVRGLSSGTRYEIREPAVSWIYFGSSHRQLLVIEIEHQGQFFYLLDIQRRPDSHEKYTLLFAASRGAEGNAALSRLSHAGIKQLLTATQCVDMKGCWQTGDTNFLCTKLKHSHSTHEQLAVKINVKIRDFRAMIALEGAALPGEDAVPQVRVVNE